MEKPYELLTRRNIMVDRYDTTRLMTSTNRDALDKLQTKIEGFTEVILKLISPTLISIMDNKKYKKWMKKFAESEKEREEKKQKNG